MIVEDNLGKEVFVVTTSSKYPQIRETFDNRIGIIMHNDEPENLNYEYMIYFPDIDNSFLCDGDKKIIAYTKEENPEYWL